MMARLSINPTEDTLQCRRRTKGRTLWKHRQFAEGNLNGTETESAIARHGELRHNNVGYVVGRRRVGFMIRSR